MAETEFNQACYHSPTGDCREPPSSLPMAELVRGLQPVVGDCARVLIIGTMPGRESLAKQEYYANPRNALWRIMEPWCGPTSIPYQRRCAQLTAVGVALWDVLLECERDGSSDSSIARPAPNEVNVLLKDHRTIAHILFNGQKARALFERLTIQVPSELALITMPSTSPANARPGKVEAWRTTLGRVLG